MRSLVWLLILGCGKTPADHPTKEQCDAFVRRGLELAFKERAAQKGVAFDPAAVDAAFASKGRAAKLEAQRNSCMQELTRAGYDCAMAAASLHALEKCDGIQ